MWSNWRRSSKQHHFWSIILSGSSSCFCFRSVMLRAWQSISCSGFVSCFFFSRWNFNVERRHNDNTLTSILSRIALYSGWHFFLLTDYDLVIVFIGSQYTADDEIVYNHRLNTVRRTNACVCERAYECAFVSNFGQQARFHIHKRAQNNIAIFFFVFSVSRESVCEPMEANVPQNPAVIFV